MAYFFAILQGILIGVGAMLPGLSGGVLSVTFGVYEPMMALFAHPIQNFPRVFPKLWPIGVGFLLGFWGISGALFTVFDRYGNLALCLFLGLILGTVPSLYKEAGKKGRHRDDYLALIFAFCAMLLGLLVVGHKETLHVTPDITWYLFAGVLWGLSIVVPGLSSSTLLIFLGLFQPMTEGLSRMDMAVVIPLIIGTVATVAISARVINRMFHRHFSLFSHGILGIVLASIVVIIPQDLGDHWLLAIGLTLIGIAIGWFLDKMWGDGKQ